MKTLLLLLVLLTGACQKPAPATSPTKLCLDPTLIRPDAMCTMQYEPVCGCDGKTYGNACAATNAGLTSFTEGPCPGAK